MEGASHKPTIEEMKEKTKEGSLLWPALEWMKLWVMGRSPSAPHGFHSTNSFFSFVSFHLLCLNPLIIKETSSRPSFFFSFINFIQWRRVDLLVGVKTNNETSGARRQSNQINPIKREMSACGYFKSKIDWWMRKEKRKFYFSFCFVNESINCGCPFNSFFSLSSLFLMGELVKKKRVDGLGRPERIENEAKQAKSLWIGWVSGGTAARQPANEEDEPPAAADWTMKRREQPSSTTNSISSFSLAFHAQPRKARLNCWWADWIVKWVCFVDFDFGWVKGGSCRTAPHKRESNQTKQTKWTMNEAKIKVKWTNQLTWVICLCGIEEFMNQWSKTKSESIEFVNGARGPPPKGAQQTINWREWMKRNGVEWNEIHLNWIVAARLWAGGHLFFHFTPLIKQIKKKRKV